MIVAGIDPGLSGAVAVIDRVRREVRVWDLPIYVNAGAKLLDSATLCSQLSGIGRLSSVVVERQQAMGNEGRSSLFKFGTVYGQVLATVQCAGREPALVFPRVWKRAYGLLGKPKEASHAVACRLYPSARKLLYGPRGGLLIDRAEALLLAHWIFFSKRGK